MRSRALEIVEVATESQPRRSSARKRKGGWSLTREGLDRLLGFLHPDREKAGEEYERIHHRLTCLFEWRRCRCPEDLADETINRVARRLDQGEVIDTRDPIEYFRGVAYRVFKEVLRAERTAKEVLQTAGKTAPEPTDPGSPDPDLSLACLDLCLEKLTDAQRQLILAYYEGDGGTRIRNRRRLMDAQGLSVAGLRMKAHRIRLRLERCVAECVDR